MTRASAFSTLLTLAGVAALAAVLSMAVFDSWPRRASQLSLKGFEDPARLARYISDKQRDSRHFWFAIVLPVHAVEAGLLWVALGGVRSKRARSNWAVFIVTVQLAAYVKLCTAGWFAIGTGMLLYPVIFLSHLTLGVVVLRSSPRDHYWPALASLCFIAAMLLQYDIGDGYGWVTITAVLGDGAGGSLSRPPSWVPEDSLRLPVWCAAMFVPSVLCWLMAMRSRVPSVGVPARA